MEKGIRDSVKYANTSSEIWSDLKERFGKESAPRAYELKKKITATRQDGSSVSTYYTRLRHLLETACALHFEAKIPKRFWGEPIVTAAYIINRLPSKVIKNKTPYELVWNEEPKYEDLRIFGCLDYFKNTNNKGDKFEEKRKTGVFLGYPQGTKGYKIYDIESKKIVVSRDVLFLEENFPFKNIAGSLDCNKDEPTKVHDDFKSTNCFLDSGEQNCFDGPPQNPSSTTIEDIGSEEENVAQHENDLFTYNSPVLGPEGFELNQFISVNMS
nr:putative ribonuclease H-like domain-containing protein [Tanacetum cinerariifolium]